MVELFAFVILISSKDILVMSFLNLNVKLFKMSSNPADYNCTMI